MTNGYVLFFAISPLAAALILGLAADLEVLGSDVADKTVSWADDAVAAIDCAYEARPLTECSPDLFNHDYTAEIARTNQLIQEMQSSSGTDSFYASIPA